MVTLCSYRYAYLSFEMESDARHMRLHTGGRTDGWMEGFEDEWMDGENGWMGMDGWVDE